MHSPFRSVCGIGFAIWTALAGCGQKADEGSARATREECQQVSEHFADVIVEAATKHLDEFWDLVHAVGGEETGLPPDLKKEDFGKWLESDQGRTWMMKRRGMTLAGTQQGVNSCVENATKRDIKCYLAATTKEALKACDAARSPVRQANTAASGSAESGSGSAAPDNGSSAANAPSGSDSAKAP